MASKSRYVETSLKPYRSMLKKIRDLEELSSPPHMDPSRRLAWQEQIRQALSADADKDTSLSNALARLLPEVYAAVCAAVRQAFGWTVFDSQLLGAVAMQQGRVIELDTGEGKTLAAVFVACLHALAGRGVHVLTFNDYLARRDANWMRPVYEWMGLTVAAVQSGMAIGQRQAAYACDVTYLTAKEAGFDYLRGFLALSEQELVQRPFYMAIVDEADSILIDEARIPLIIASDAAGPGSIDPALYQLVSGMRQGRHYGLDTFGEHVLITEEGAIWLEHHLGISNLYASEQVGLLTQIRLILQAKTLFRRDVDYIVRDGRIELVDEFTGRIVENRQLPEGLHEAVEVKEGLTGKMQGRILNRITLRDFLSLYEHICGMTGTASSAAPELDAFYRLGVTRIPPHVPCRRMDQPDLIFRTKAEKEQAILREISQRHACGQPVLVGTASVEESERLVSRVREYGFACEVLNARHDETEAEIIAQAGQSGAITISTNMAGRGVDIRLGEGVAAGLYIIGTNRHRSIRIDRQLRGRAGRQGDPGESRFFVSLQDDLIERYQVR
ncbi:MAG TPA: accessory Sec system translocase SecA2, partial [Clostridia bacterium]